jgi:hypothetical protein
MSSTLKNRGAGRLRDNRPGKHWIQFVHVAEPLSRALIPAGSPAKLPAGPVRTASPRRNRPTPPSRVSSRSSIDGSTGNRLVGTAPPSRSSRRTLTLTPRLPPNAAAPRIVAAVSRLTIAPRRRSRNISCSYLVKKIGFKAYYDKKRYEVKCPDFLNKDKKSHPHEAAKRLVHDSLFCRRHRSRTCRQAGDVSSVNWRP